MGSTNVTTPTPSGAAAAAQAAAVVGGLPCGVFVSSLIDFTTVADNIAFLPANPGQYFLGVRFAIETAALTGTATGSLVYSVGNNASHDNIISQAVGTISSAGINALTGSNAPPVIGTFNNLGGTGTLVDNTTPIVVKVVTPATGVTVLKMRFVFLGTWISTTLP